MRLFKHDSIWFTTFIVVLGFFLWYVADLVLLGFATILFAIFLRSLTGMVRYVTKFGEKLSLVLAVVLLFVISGLLGWMLAADIIAQTNELSARLPEAWRSLEEIINSYPLGKTLLHQASHLDRLVTERPQIIARAGSFLSSTLAVLSTLFLIFLAGLFMAFQPKAYIVGFVRLFPLDRRDRMYQVMYESGYLLQRWLVGKFFSMLAIGSLTTIGLSIIDVQPALALGLLAGILAFIPYIGPILSSFPAIILGFAIEPIHGAYVIGVFFVVQIIESNLITPFIERKSVWLPPAFTIFMQVLFTILFGFLGVLLASPLAAVTLLFVKKLYVEDVLEAST